MPRKARYTKEQRAVAVGHAVAELWVSMVLAMQDRLEYLTEIHTDDPIEKRAEQIMRARIKQMVRDAEDDRRVAENEMRAAGV